MEDAMSYATILVNLALDHPNEAALAVAGDLADKTGARVIGVAAAEFSPPAYYTAGAVAQQIIETGEGQIRARLAACEQRFREALSSRTSRLEWRSALAMPAVWVAEQARAADVIVSGRGGAHLTDPYAHADPDDLVMLAGRPLLIVPEATTWLDLRRGLVAWKDTAEARRAVAAALPLLRLVGDITVAAIPEQPEQRTSAEAGARDVVGWLSAHGITATVLVTEAAPDAAARLQRLSEELGSGVLVAGAYGHSRLREWVFGGVTRQIVSRAACCALVSR
jgi:nucleotide-binding universal stress UspA family protein